MTLSTHIIIAAAITKPLVAQNPLFAFIISLASHYMSDAIPHWDYSLQSTVRDENTNHEKIIFTKKTFYNDLMRAGVDFAIGSIVVYVLFRPTTLNQYLFLIAIIAGSVLPDFLQGMYYGLHLKSIKIHQTFHDRMHTKIKLGPYPKIGIPFQLLIVIISLLFFI